MFRLHLEWDYGQDKQIFIERDHAHQWMSENIDLDDFDPPFPTTDQIFEQGLASFEEVFIYKPG